MKETNSAELKQEWRLFKRCWIVHIFSERARAAHLGILQPETILKGKPQDLSIKDILTLPLGTDFSAHSGSFSDQNLDSLLGATVPVVFGNQMWLSLLSPIPCMHAKLLQSCLTLWTPWTIAQQAPHSMELPRQEYWSGLPFPSPGDLPDPGIKPASLMSPGISTSSTTWEGHMLSKYILGGPCFLVSLVTDSQSADQVDLIGRA